MLTRSAPAEIIGGIEIKGGILRLPGLRVGKKKKNGEGWSRPIWVVIVVVRHCIIVNDLEIIERMCGV